MIDTTLKNANILVVDDQQANLDVISGLLEMQQYTNLKTVTDPREVIPLLATFKPDLIILDLSMPHMSGYEVMERLGLIIPANEYLPILVITADATSEAKQRALSGGANDYLTKPFDLDEVGLRIRNLLYTRFLNQQLLNQKLILEEKVKERTSQLELKNQELIIAKEKAEASEQLKTSFINNISHEIRTPLNGILGIGQILSEKNFSPERMELYLELMDESSERLIATVTNFLDIALISSNNLTADIKQYHLAPIISKTIEKFSKRFANKGITISQLTSTVDHSTQIFTDLDLLSKVIFQIIDNAVKFTKDGRIDIRYDIEGGELKLIIKDTGIGISADNQQRIFSIFTQEDVSRTRGYDGNGLGLAIVNGIVEKLKGNICIQSEKGLGTTLFITLPTTIEDCVKVKGIQKTSSLKKESYTVLIAEDDEINFSFLSYLLENDHINILHAWNGSEAIDICKRHPEINVVLMDVRMPVMGGLEASKIIKTMRRDLPIIVTTAYAGTVEKDRAILAGCDDFISKPLNKTTLFDTLRKHKIYIS